MFISYCDQISKLSFNNGEKTNNKPHNDDHSFNVITLSFFSSVNMRLVIITIPFIVDYKTNLFAFMRAWGHHNYI